MTTDPPAEADPGATLTRFDGVERALHWVNAALFGVLMATAVPLYLGSASSFIGRRALLADIHTWCGVALPIPLLLSVAGPWGRELRRDLGRFNRWSTEEMHWLRTFGRHWLLRPGKFNPGQKLNAAFTAGAMAVMLGTGSVMRWFGPFPDSWRTGATFVHDLGATAVFVVVAGHVAFALGHPQALRAMVTGRIRRTWAVAHAPLWLDELDGSVDPDRAATRAPASAGSPAPQG